MSLLIRFQVWIDLKALGRAKIIVAIEEARVSIAALSATVTAADRFKILSPHLSSGSSIRQDIRKQENPSSWLSGR